MIEASQVPGRMSCGERVSRFPLKEGSGDTAKVVIKCVLLSALTLVRRTVVRRVLTSHASVISC